MLKGGAQPLADTRARAGKTQLLGRQAEELLLGNEPSCPAGTSVSTTSEGWTKSPESLRLTRCQATSLSLRMEHAWTLAT